MRLFRRFPRTILALSGLVLELGGIPSFAQATSHSSHVELWGIEEVTLHSNRDYDNPFTDVSVQGRFHSNTAMP